MAPPSPRAVLLQFAGNKRNAPKTGAERPAMRVAAEVGAAARSFVLYTRGDEVAKELAESLVVDMNRDPRGGHTAKHFAVDAGAPPDPHRRAHVDEGVRRFVEHLASKAELGSRFEACEFAVSLATGTPAQWSSLVDALDARGVRIRLWWERSDDTLANWRGSPAAYGMEPSLAMLARAPAARTVLLTGPTGAGKTHAAQRLHDDWAKHLGRAGEMVAVNAAALPRELLESTLFGHVRGAFTGATRNAPGALARAKGGTLFLDEIGELPLDLQSKLLTVLDANPATGERTFTPVGASKAERSDFRLVLGTNQDLLAMTRDGRFRVDLYGRVSTHQVSLPPLSSVRHHIPSAYVRHLEALSAHYPRVDRRPVTFGFTREARRRLLDFALSDESAWPWNHRDVQQSAERLAMRAWNRGAPTRGPGEAPSWTVTIPLDDITAELAELTRRWASLEDTSTDDDRAWDAVRARVRADAWDALSQLERWELRHLLEAQSHSESHAEAWQWIAARNLLPGARDAVKNPSNAFAKRWAKYHDTLRPDAR